MKFRLGIDFGYAYTGIALLNSSNKVLDYKVLKHRPNLSGTLQARRANRGQRRRKLSKVRRLRDFYALLKGMGLEPRNARPREKQTERDKASLGNRLYSLAHYRGWDYASLLELLVVKTDDDKAPQCPPMVKEIDEILLQEFDAPAKFNEKERRKNKESVTDYEKAQKDAKREYNKGSRHSSSQKFSNTTIRFIKIKQSCLGELYKKAKKIHNLRKKAEKNSSSIEDIEKQEAHYEELATKLQNATTEDIKDWLHKRLEAVYGAGKPIPKEKEIIDRIMTKLGLQTSEKLFEEGKAYRPHRNRHRSEMLENLKSMMNIACGLRQDGLQNCLDETLRRLQKSKVKLTRSEIEQDWKRSIAEVHQKAVEIAHRTSTTPEEIKARWVKAARKIVNREYRKKRFNNRNSMGKCPAAKNDKTRCGRNVPKKCREDIRKFQFEIELRQMNVSRMNGEEEKLREDEVEELMGKLVFMKKPNRDNKKENSQAINSFFTDKKGDRYVPPAKNEARGKKDILKDIVCGEQSGRAGFCVKHLEEKLELLKHDETKNEAWSEAWARLHEERVLTLKDDAPPSIRQKVEKTISVVRKMLREQGVQDISNPPLEHVGIETARFDINALAQSEGKKLKKKLKPKQYQQSVGGDRASLLEDQGDRCIFCGELLGGDAHIDHLFPKSKGGGNIALNKVVGHAICNIDKHKRQEPLAQAVLSSIKENNPKKYRFIQRRLEADGRLPGDMLDAPQHTMFGAKLLKQAFIDEFNLSSKVIQKIRSGDSSYLRRFWFPFMNKQKWAMRSRNLYRAKVDEEFKRELPELKLDEYLYGEGVSIERGYDEQNQCVSWLEIKNDFIAGTPCEGDEGANNQFYLIGGKNKFILKVVILTNDDKKEKILYEYKGLLGQKLKLSLKDVFSKDRVISKLLKNSDADVQLKYRKDGKESGNGWLRAEGDVLIGVPSICCQDPIRKRYVPWCAVEIIDKNTGVVPDTKIWIKTKIAVRPISIVVEPEKDDPIRKFHHALDAVVVGADADWDKIRRLNKDARSRNYLDRKKMFEQARRENAPVFEDLREDDRGNLLAPKKTSDWYIEDEQNQGKKEYSKTGLEPLSCLSNEVVLQRKPLEKIQKKNVKNIQSDLIKKAMNEAWKEIEAMPNDRKKAMTDGRGEERTITHSYFMSLPKDHILHPHNTRSARCKVVRGTGKKQQLWEREDKNTQGTHYFKRVVPWDVAKVIQYKDPRGKDKKCVVRFAANFYWKDKKKPSYERNEIDKKLPDNYEVLATFKKRDVVTVEGKKGKWKITKLTDPATLKNVLRPDEKPISIVYRKLIKI